MFEKGNRYLADWYDRKGKRKRKSFETPEAAQAFEDSMRAQAHPKKKGAGLQSRKPSSTSTALYLLAIPAAYVRPALALGLIVVVSILWLLPPRAEVDGTADMSE
jgi:hypothetical protein